MFRVGLNYRELFSPNTRPFIFTGHRGRGPLTCLKILERLMVSRPAIIISKDLFTQSGMRPPLRKFRPALNTVAQVGTKTKAGNVERVEGQGKSAEGYFSETTPPRLPWVQMLLFSRGKPHVFSITLHYFIVQQEGETTNRPKRGCFWSVL